VAQQTAEDRQAGLACLRVTMPSRVKAYPYTPRRHSRFITLPREGEVCTVSKKISHHPTQCSRNEGKLTDHHHHSALPFPLHQSTEALEEDRVNRKGVQLAEKRRKKGEPVTEQPGSEVATLAPAAATEASGVVCPMRAGQIVLSRGLW
jgi:hypothetical protein